MVNLWAGSSCGLCAGAVAGSNHVVASSVKTRGHWQSDVLVGAAIGTGVGLWASHRQSPLIIGWLPGGFQIGFIHHFK